MSEKQKDFMEEFRENRVEFKLSLYKPYYDFMKEYLAFFGDKKTIEDLCRMMIYENVKQLYQAFDDFVLSKISHIEEDSWPSKWQFIKIAIGPPKEKEAEES